MSSCVHDWTSTAGCVLVWKSGELECVGEKVKIGFICLTDRLKLRVAEKREGYDGVLVCICGTVCVCLCHSYCLTLHAYIRLCICGKHSGS